MFRRFLGVLSLLFFFSGSVHAAELAPKGTCQRKFQRGLLNMGLAPLEITHALAQEKREDKAFIPWVMGLGRGSWLAAIRAFVGVYETATAPFPIPPRYRPIVLPEFSLEYLGLLKDES